RSESGTWRAVEIGEAVKTVSQPPPPPAAPATMVPTHETRDPIRAAQQLATSLRAGRIHTPPGEDIGMHTCGLVIVHGTGDGETFAARLEALRTYSGTLATRM